MNKTVVWLDEVSLEHFTKGLTLRLFELGYVPEFIGRCVADVICATEDLRKPQKTNE